MAKLDNKGRLEAVATPPGQYILMVRAYKGTMTQMIERELVVPEGEGLVDLGELPGKISR